MVNWFRGVISAVLPASIGQGGEAYEKKAKPKLFDVTDGYYLVEEAKKWGLSLIRRSRDDFGDLRARLRTRQKVRKNLISSYDLPDIVDEVTEKLTDASRDDSRINTLLNG